MAEARHGEEGELKDASVMRNRNQATGKKYTSVLLTVLKHLAEKIS